MWLKYLVIKFHIQPYAIASCISGFGIEVNDFHHSITCKHKCDWIWPNDIIIFIKNTRFNIH